MIASFLVVFVALAACQALLAVKLADLLSPSSEAGKATAQPARRDGTVSLA
ncbi:hypothetical protein MKL09_20110 [Methylobacterium sp. J-048]|uniref:hypothetical protein n=1 Tax=Methylobacterium sp. J-048 TaxID=2836635 RepID=UPI001FBB78B6|nr:hypothetical protein [Methylobacterium sp. J-048]MCJ2058839.1 hypothetical protein [Methylobacterium sp. J-048]